MNFGREDKDTRELMKFSILMANYNKEKYLVEAIQSVLSQTYENWELIVVDDNSKDNSLKIINSFSSNEKIKIIKNEINLGYTDCLKKMIDIADGEVMVILDSDDAIADNALEEINQIYNKHPECGYIYSQCMYCDENLEPIHLGYSKIIPEGKTNLQFNIVIAIKTFKRECYFKTLGYDSGMKYAEDVDLTFKIEEVTKLYFLDKVLYYYRILKYSQTHGVKNELINRSSTALAKLNAYERRLKTDIPNLNKSEISEVLFLGILSSVLVFRFSLAKLFIKKIFIFNPYFFIDYRFYGLVIKKIFKIIKIKFK